MTVKLGVIMDPIDRIHFKKDSTLGMLLEAKKRGWEIYYFEQKDIFLMNGKVHGNARKLIVHHDANNWFEFKDAERILLSELNVILMRKDPPFDLEYIYSTYLLEQVERDGVLIVNNPQSLRDANEKLFTAWFPQCCPPSIVTRDMKMLKEFFQEQKDIVCKPLDTMGGSSILRLKYPDENASVVFELLTKLNTETIMAQRYIPEILDGDKRIILINGEPIPFALARIPAKGELRGNLAAGGKGVVRPLTEKDLWICNQIGPTFKNKGLLFVGIDVIGDYLTEINVTSPTGMREIEAEGNVNIAKQLFDEVEKLL